MNSKLGPEPHYRVLHQRLNEAFTPTYLTILSIIQAVALTDLATIVAAEYRQFTVVHWLFALLTFRAYPNNPAARKAIKPQAK